MTQTSTPREEEKESGEQQHQPVVMAGMEMPNDGSGILELDGMAESESVGKVLELLCGLGAAYKYLCQVSVTFLLEMRISVRVESDCLRERKILSSVGVNDEYGSSLLGRIILLKI